MREKNKNKLEKDRTKVAKSDRSNGKPGDWQSAKIIKLDIVPIC